MARTIIISRDEAEALVDLIEAADCPFPLDILAGDLRVTFGMCTREEELSRKAERDAFIGPRLVRVITLPPTFEVDFSSAFGPPRRR